MSYENADLILAGQFVNYTDRNIFLTGRAGTGKTTFLRDLKQKNLKNAVVVAPTGVAAINAGGVTIHSFFQLPFGPILPSTKLNEKRSFDNRFGKNKINLIRSIDLLIIDEISMVRADLLDGIDRILRMFRDPKKVFGGLQILMIGDLYQLPPVVKESEWNLLQDFYDSEYFYSSKAFLKCNPVCIELQFVYRQCNENFIRILNEIRNNSLTQYSVHELNKRNVKNVDFRPNDGYIYLNTHNFKTKRINDRKLELIDSPPFTYNAIIEGKFPESSYPNKSELTLKIGAQVMFIKNDRSDDKKYYNGKIGEIVSLTSDKIKVLCKEDGSKIDVEYEMWDNIKYSIDPNSLNVREERIGSYSQIPLKLAWAITIHKSQGLTFDKAYIDVQDSFAHGQTYVALSRCRSIEGLILASDLSPSHVKLDKKVIKFHESLELRKPDESILHISKKEFQIRLIFNLFDFYPFLLNINKAIDIIERRRNVTGNLYENLTLIKAHVVPLLKINNKLNSEIFSKSEIYGQPLHSEKIQDLFKRAIQYFNPIFKKNILDPYSNIEFATDNKVTKKELIRILDLTDEIIATKQSHFEQLTLGFDVETYLRAKINMVQRHKSNAKKNVVNREFQGTEHKELYETLKLLRLKLSKDNNLIAYQIFPNTAIQQICQELPRNKSELSRIKGFGATRIEKYGDAIIGMINNYCSRL